MNGTTPTSRAVEIVGARTSAGAVRPGMERAPDALRAPLAERLTGHGLRVLDRGGGLVVRRDPDGPQRVSDVVRAAQDVRARVRRALLDGHLPIVLGGDCTVEVGVVAAHLDDPDRQPDAFGLVYVDAHADLNVPGSVPDDVGPDGGADGDDVFTETLDWMGNAHLLGLDGAEPELTGIGPRRPLLAPRQLALVGLVDGQATPFERETRARLGLAASAWDDVAADPEGVARALLTGWAADFDRVAVHLDTDALNSDEAPVAEAVANWGVGLTLDAAGRLLAALAADPRFAGLTVTEVFPPHAETDPAFGPALAALVGRLADALGPALSS